MPETANDYSDQISRRRFVEVAGASGAAALAGCTSDDSDDSGGGAGATGPTFKNGWQGNPSQTHFNRLATKNFDYVPGRLIFGRFGAYNFAKSDFVLSALEDWSIDGTTVTLTIREDLNWDNGDPVTARDLLTQLRLQKKADAQIWDFTDSVSKVDEKTVELTLKEESHPKIIKHTLANQYFSVKHDVFEEFLDKDASAIQTYEWTENIRSSGPWSFESKDNQQFSFNKNSEYFNADGINFQTYDVVRRSSNTAVQQGLNSGDIDATTSLFVPKKIADSFSSDIEEINIPAKWGYGVIFNHEDPDYGKRKVRQAIAHVINRQQLVENAGPATKFVTPVPCGIAPKDQDRWLGDDKEAFESYGPKSEQTERAATLLEEAGYSKSGGTWTDENGKPLGGTYLTPAGWSDWTTMTDTVVDQLNSFGFDLSIESKASSKWSSAYIDSNFRIGSYYWLPGGARSAFPYFPLRFQIINDNLQRGHNFPEGERTVPGMDGGEMTIDPETEIENLATTPDDETARPIIKRLAWHNNKDLPQLGLVSKYEQSWLTSDDWNVPSKDDDSRKVKWPTHWLPRKGKLTAKES